MPEYGYVVVKHDETDSISDEHRYPTPKDAAIAGVTFTMKEFGWDKFMVDVTGAVPVEVEARDIDNVDPDNVYSVPGLGAVCVFEYGHPEDE